MLTLESPHLRATIDASGGADILSLVHRDTGIDVLFSTPWRPRADAVRAGSVAATSHDPIVAPLEQYAGGWQTLCPVAGGPRTYAGAAAGFHGEAWLAAWDVTASDSLSATMRTELFTAPVLIERRVVLDPTRATITVDDTLTNLSDVDLEMDYVSHPAFAGEILDGDCVIDTGARTFTADWGTDSIVRAGSVHVWPLTTDGVDLRIVPPPGERRMLFGWMSDFDAHWATVTNRDLGLRVRLEWDGTRLPHAWVWQELNWTQDFPWFRRARVIAIEPASTPPGGPDRRSSVRLTAYESIEIAVALTIDGAGVSHER